MLAKKFPIKPKVINFSSEDSQDTDASLNSSIEVVDENTKNSVANKFNQLRETMNKYFMANPELAEEIRFEQYTAPDDDDQQPNLAGTNSPDRAESPQAKRADRGAGSLSSEIRGTANGRSLSRQQTQTLKIPQEEPQVSQLSGATNKLWSSFSSHMARGQRNSKAPSLAQITHMLNLFKVNFEKPSVLDNTMTSPKGITASPRKTQVLTSEKPDFRIQSAKSVKDGKGKHGKDGKKKGENQEEEDNEEDGVTYFSVRKKKHLQMKHKIREQSEQNREQRKKDKEELDRLSKERDQRHVMNTLAELDEELNRKGPSIPNPPRSKNDLEKGDLTGKNKKRRNSTKPSTNIFDRLTKDTSNRNDFEERTFNTNGKVFHSAAAESLYNEMKAFGNNEGFKRIANFKINAFKREFKEKMAAQRKVPTDGLKFTKEDTKYFNTFLPDFDRTAHIPNKDSVFIHNEVIRGSEEWRENPENELLAKLQKMTNGTLFEYWRDAKELNQ